MSSYQIKSTPYFRRILSISKKSGQLEKLKEEYERIKEFNEKAIEMKMRQVRLKRLYQEIDTLRETNIKKKRLIPPPTVKKLTIMNSMPNKRLENLKKAKELGKYYSRCNADGSRNDMEEEPSTSNTNPLDISMITKRQFREREREMQERLRAQINRGKNYGNKISNWNMQKMLKEKLRTKVDEGIQVIAATTKSWNRRQGSQTTSETSLEGRDNLKNGIAYGNAISDLNTKLRPKKKRTHKNSNMDPNSESCKKLVTALSQTDSMMMEAQLYQSCLDLQDHLELNNVKSESLHSSDQKSRLMKRRKALKHWRKILILLKCHSAINETSPSFENDLRSISNDINILQNDFDQNENFDMISDSEENLQNETFLHTESLYEHPASPSKSSIVVLNSNPLPLMSEKHTRINPILKATKENELQTLIRNYEPYSMKVVQNEIMEMGVQKLREIFEHQNTL